MFWLKTFNLHYKCFLKTLRLGCFAYTLLLDILVSKWVGWSNAQKI